MTHRYCNHNVIHLGLGVDGQHILSIFVDVMDCWVKRKYVHNVDAANPKVYRRKFVVALETG